MKCPKCEHEVKVNQTVCPHCGAQLSRTYNPAFDNDLVFSERDMPKRKNKTARNVFLIAVILLVIFAVVIGGMWFMQRRGKGSAPKQQESTTAAVTTLAEVEPATAAEQTAQTAVETTAPATPAQKNAEEKIRKYVNDSDIYEELLAEADGNMQVGITVEKNLLIARYTVAVDSQAEEQQEYISTLDGYFDELCSHLDGAVYDLKNQSGVDNAAIEVVAADQNNSILFTQIVD